MKAVRHTGKHRHNISSLSHGVYSTNDTLRLGKRGLVLTHRTVDFSHPSKRHKADGSTVLPPHPWSQLPTDSTEACPSSLPQPPPVAGIAARDPHHGIPSSTGGLPASDLGADPAGDVHNSQGRSSQKKKKVLLSILTVWQARSQRLENHGRTIRPMAGSLSDDSQENAGT